MLVKQKMFEKLLIQLKTPTESEISGIYTYVLETYLNIVIIRAWDDIIYVDKHC